MRVSLTSSVSAMFSVAFHQLSKITPEVCHFSPSDLILSELSGDNIDISLPSPTKNDVVSVIANEVVQSETMSICRPSGMSIPESICLSFRPPSSFAYSIR